VIATNLSLDFRSWAEAKAVATISFAARKGLRGPGRKRRYNSDSSLVERNIDGLAA
jgi:hypothetical protein